MVFALMNGFCSSMTLLKKSIPRRVGSPPCQTNSTTGVGCEEM